MRVLIADDDPTMLRIASLSLKAKGGHEVACACDGAQAVFMAEADPPELIILDGLMPVMDGIEAFRRLRESPKTREIPIIFLSAQQESQELARLKALGPAGIISKPFNPLLLADQVRAILEKPPPAQPS